MNKIKNYFKYLIILLPFISGPVVSFASQTDGIIDSTNHSALLCMNDSCTTTTRINFITTNGRPVHVTDSNIVGDIWSEQMGWINLDPTNSGVINDGEGYLSGHAWGENSGWINFNPSNGGVSIINGEFSGYAWAQNHGWIKFDCNTPNACVKTDWRKPSGGGGNSGGTGSTSGGDITLPPDVVVTPPDITPPDVIDIPDNVVTPEVVIPPEVTVTPEIDVITDPINDENSSSSDTNTNNENDYFNIENFNFITYLIGETGLGGILNNTNNFIRESVPNIINDPVGRVTTQAVATTGAVVGSIFSFTTILFANPISFSEIFLIPIRIWGLILTAFGLRKRNRPWGTVYDSITKQPLDPVYVILQDLQGNEVATSITDIDGRYGFLVPSGVYRIIARKTNYIFPSQKLLGKISDEIYQDLYFNEIIEIKEGEVITRNIPMDPLKFDWNEFAKRDQNKMKFFNKRDIFISKLANLLFWIGFVFSMIVFLIAPSTYNIIIFVIYIILLILKNTIIKPRSFGTVTYGDKNLPLSFAIMRIFFAGSDHEVTHKVTDKTGKYYCLVPNGIYYINIENKNPDETYSLIHTTGNIEVKRGYINNKIEIN